MKKLKIDKLLETPGRYLHMVSIVIDRPKSYRILKSSSKYVLERHYKNLDPESVKTIPAMELLQETKDSEIPVTIYRCTRKEMTKLPETMKPGRYLLIRARSEKLEQQSPKR